jgi:acyl-coenzyme A thioesterase 13
LRLYAALQDRKEGETDMVEKITVTEGEFAGWTTYEISNTTFDSTVGPFYRKPDPDGSMRCAFRAEQKHMNFGGRMHGGCLMTFADIAMFQIAYQEMEGASGVTVQLDSTFIDGAYVGELIEATGQVTKAGKSLIFVRGQINTGERLLMTFSGVIRKFTPRD